MIRIDYKSPYFLLAFPFNKTELEIVRNLPVREWDKKEKVWKVPHLVAKTLDILTDTYWTETAKQAYKIINAALMQLVDCKFAKVESDGKLRPYQAIGAKYITLGKKILLGDDMGLGKSIQAIKAILDLNCKEVLILCPATIKWKWQNEFQKHYETDSIVIHGSKKERAEQWKRTGIKIANYDLLIRDWQIMPKEYDAIIADECLAPESLIWTEFGELPIKDIVEKQLNIRVWTYNVEQDIFELKSIKCWKKSRQYAPLIKINNLNCTPNHSIYFDEKKVIDLKKHQIEVYNGMFHLRKNTEKRNIYEFIGLENASYYSLSNSISFTGNSSDGYVYNIEVEDNHNYIANGILVGNCIYLKNLKAQRTKLANRLKANIKIGLSGYYMEKDLLEFYGPFNWCRPDVLPPFWRFKYRYCNFGWDGKIIGYKNLEELHLLTSPFILRRTKEEVAPELPPKIYTDYPMELEGKHLDTYEALANDYILWLYAQTGKNWQMTGLLKTIRLRQFVEFPEIAGFKLNSPKLEWLDDIILQVDKIVVFTFFEQSVKRMVEHYKTPYFITGAVPTKKRQEIVDTFNKKKKAIMISDDAGRFGIDLVGADNIVHFGSEFNPATMKQREDRLHRIGQEKIVNILSPYFENTIDEGIRNIFLQRQKDNDNFMEGNLQMSIARLSKQDFEKMIHGK